MEDNCYFVPGSKSLLLPASRLNAIQRCQFSMTKVMERKKKIKWPKHEVQDYGAAFRRATGQSTMGDRYGPFLDKPDYTFLGNKGNYIVSDEFEIRPVPDGRPTPLTPEQIQLREDRIDIASKIVSGYKEMTAMKEHSDNRWKLIEEERQKQLGLKLKPKS